VSTEGEANGKYQKEEEEEEEKKESALPARSSLIFLFLKKKKREPVTARYGWRIHHSLLLALLNIFF
jgi:hypothetical protein